MDFQRRRSVIITISLIFISCTISSSSSGQVNDSDLSSSFSISYEYIMQSYFSTHDSFHESEFRSFLLKDRNIVPAVSLMQHRNITGQGSHRNLLTSIKLLVQSQFDELVIVERLPLGVYADPFELQNLQEKKVFKDVSVFGDTNLELPSFRSNRSFVEIHVDISGRDYVNGEIDIKLPLHARYQPLDESGYYRVEFEEPDLFLCSSYAQTTGGHEQKICLVLSISGGLKKTETSPVFWDIPAGIRSHTEYVSAFTFAAAVLSAFSIIVASVSSLKVESCKNAKQS